MKMELEAGVTGAMKYAVAAIASLGMMELPFDLSAAAAMLLGLVSGTLLSWGFASYQERKLKKNWLILQMATYPAFMIVILWQGEMWDISNKALAGILCIMSFLSYEAIARIKPKLLKKVDDIDI